ncbi:unnamed protein product [Cylindrotheca closterium]|uniref:TFIIS-type domain-containing protein n=1 Tax=Cylindrotheca closterium TaxID=2856 RepID=A0AAD2CQR5_9STRA|nr:unnamed protein product [Cylindrotheca closterium]
MEEEWEGQQDVGVAEEEEQEDDEGDILDMGEDDQETNEKEGLLMRFCPNDSSMLYPQEDKRNRTLQYSCRLCSYKEATPQYPLIYRNNLKHEVGNVLNNVPSSIADDPTLARSQNAKCSNCNHNEAVFFQSDVAQADSLALIFVCCNCGHKWVN